MALATSSLLQTHLGISSALATKVMRFVPQASVSVRSYVTKARYVLLEAADSSDAKKQKAEQAECLLAYYYALPQLAMREVNESGGFVRSVGIDERRQELVGQREVGRLQSSFYSQADALLRDLMETDYEVSAPVTWAIG